MSEYALLGETSRNNAQIRSFICKVNDVTAGDLMKIKETSDIGAPEVEKISAVADCIFGVASFNCGVKKGYCAVVYSGYVVANPDSTKFTAIKVGIGLQTVGANKCCCPKVIAKLKYDKAGTSTDCYELLL